jgi:thiol-disulfide isomerase/thioredoxin
MPAAVLEARPDAGCRPQCLMPVATIKESPMITSLLLTCLALSAHPIADAPFQDLTFDQALAAAKKEQKIVMVDFFTTWCVPCKKLDKITWKDADVQAWIAKTAVALKLDAEKEVDLAKRFKIESYPTILFVKADGSEIDRLLGFKEPAEFIPEATSALAGKDAVERVKEKMAGKADGPMARQSLGDALTARGKYAEALDEYLWCFDHGLEKEPSYVGVRISFLVSRIAELGSKYPPATQALEVRRDAAESALFSENGDSSNARELFSINGALEASDRNIAAWERLKKENKYDSSMRLAGWMFLVEPLVKAKRYADAVDAGGDLAAKAKWYIQLEGVSPKSKSSSHEEADELTRSAEHLFMLSRVGALYEAAIGADQAKMSSSIADQLLSFDPGYSTYVELIDRAVRAGAFDTARAMAERGIAAVPEKTRPILQDALKRIPEKK